MEMVTSRKIADVDSAQMGGVDAEREAPPSWLEAREQAHAKMVEPGNVSFIANKIHRTGMLRAAWFPRGRLPIMNVVMWVYLFAAGNVATSLLYFCYNFNLFQVVASLISFNSFQVGKAFCMATARAKASPCMAPFACCPEDRMAIVRQGDLLMSGLFGDNVGLSAMLAQLWFLTQFLLLIGSTALLMVAGWGHESVPLWAWIATPSLLVGFLLSSFLLILFLGMRTL